MIDKSQMKAYAGGLSGSLGVLAGATVADDLAKVIAWLVSLTGTNAPTEVAEPLARLIMLIGGFVGGKFITYWFPPNEVNPDGKIEVYVTRPEEKGGSDAQ